LAGKIFFARRFQKGMTSRSSTPLNGTPIGFASVAFAMLVLLWLYAIGWALIGYPIYRDQHMGAALEYASNGIDLLRPVIVGFNANGTGTPQELPLWQAAASIGLNLFGGWWGGATIVSLLLFTVFLPAFYQSAKWETNAAFAWLAVALLLAQPIVFHLAGGAQTDGFSLALLLAFIWSTELLRRKPGLGRWLACALLTALLAVTKFPYLMTGGFAALLMLLWHRAPLKSWLLLAGAAGVAAAAFIPWNAWCNAEIGRALFKYRPLTISENPQWFFGDLAYRLDPANYIKAGWRSLSCLWGSFVLVGLTLYGLWLRPKSLGSALLIGALVTTLVFTKLVLIHRHYYLMFSPAVALLNAYAVYELWQRLRDLSAIKSLLASAAVLVLMTLSLLQGLMQIEALTLTADPHMQSLAGKVAQHTSPDDRLIVINGGWGGDLLILSERRGMSIDSTAVAENAHTRARLQQLGYNKLVVASESPLLHAVQMANPGEGDLERIVWPLLVTPEVMGWPLDYKSDDLLIVTIPPLTSDEVRN
jgi:hypothetical protein